MREKDVEYEQAISAKKIPILTLDNKWYKLFDNLQGDARMSAAVQKLNDLLKRQGKVNTEIKDIKKLKKKLRGTQKQQGRFTMKFSIAWCIFGVIGVIATALTLYERVIVPLLVWLHQVTGGAL